MFPLDKGFRTNCFFGVIEEKMMNQVHYLLANCCGAAGLVFAALASAPATAQTAKLVLKGVDGKEVGNVELLQTPAGVLLKLSVKGLPAGEHAFHVHAVGKCEAPFTSAGGHFNPDNKKHGIMAAEGHHAGDMPNLHIPQSGELARRSVECRDHLGEGETPIQSSMLMDPRLSSTQVKTTTRRTLRETRARASPAQ